MKKEQLPEGWEVKKLGEVCVNFDSKRVPITQHKRNAGEFPYYGASGIVDYVSNYIFDEDLLLVSEDGANLLARTYPIAFSIKGKSWVNNHAHVLKFEQMITQQFVEYYLNSIKLNSFVSGMAQPKLNQQMLNSIPIPIPPLSQQQHIVTLLNNIFTTLDQAKANVQKNIENARELFQSELNAVFAGKLFDGELTGAEGIEDVKKILKSLHPQNPDSDNEGWVEKKLKDVCDMKPQKKEARDKLNEDDLVSFLPMEDLGVEGKNIIAIKERTLKEVSGSYTYFANKDVLLAKITPCFENGKIGLANGLKNGIGFGSSEYIVFRSNGEVSPELIYYFLSRKTFREEGRKLMTGAVGHKRVSKDWIDNYIIPFPKSPKTQQTIVTRLNALSAETKKLEAHYQQKLMQLEELRKSVLERAFKGCLNQDLQD